MYLLLIKIGKTSKTAKSPFPRYPTPKPSYDHKRGATLIRLLPLPSGPPHPDEDPPLPSPLRSAPTPPLLKSMRFDGDDDGVRRSYHPLPPRTTPTPRDRGGDGPAPRATPSWRRCGASSQGAGGAEKIPRRPRRSVARGPRAVAAAVEPAAGPLPAGWPVGGWRLAGRPPAARRVWPGPRPLPSAGAGGAARRGAAAAMTRSAVASAGLGGGSRGAARWPRPWARRWRRGCPPKGGARGRHRGPAIVATPSWPRHRGPAIVANDGPGAGEADRRGTARAAAAYTARAP
jgi:hypothetical protein